MNEVTYNKLRIIWVEYIGSFHHALNQWDNDLWTPDFRLAKKILENCTFELRGAWTVLCGEEADIASKLYRQVFKMIDEFDDFKFEWQEGEKT
jgi:hypothetical protein